MKNSNFLTKSISKLSFFDFNAPSIGFTLGGEDVVSHWIGGVVSLITSFFAFYLSWKTLANFIFRTNAEIAIGSKFENSNLSFDSETMFMALGFYYPYTQSSSNLDTSGNNFNVADNIKKIDLSCVACNLNTTTLQKCSPTKFNDVTISAMSGDQSASIVENMKKYSFCLPDRLSGEVVEKVPFGKSASIEVQMPFDRTVAPKKSEDPAKQIETGGFSFSNVQEQIKEIAKVSDQLVKEQEEKKKEAEIAYQSLVASGYKEEDYKSKECDPEDITCINTQNGENIDGMGGMEWTDGMGGMEWTDGMGGMNSTDGMGEMEWIDGMGGMEGMDWTDGMGEMEWTDGMGGMEWTDGMGGMEWTDGMGGMEWTDGMGGMEWTDGMGGMEWTDGMGGMEGMNSTDGTEWIDGNGGNDGTELIDENNFLRYLIQKDKNGIKTKDNTNSKENEHSETSKSSQEKVSKFLTNKKCASEFTNFNIEFMQLYEIF